MALLYDGDATEMASRRGRKAVQSLVKEGLGAVEAFYQS
jgi:hypothetical protein